MTSYRYAIALGSNRRGRFGSPEAQIESALNEVGGVVRRSRILRTAPLGPSKRRFANAAAIIETPDTPDALLRRLKAIEHRFGRRRGQSWGARVIDLDVILWSEGSWASEALTIPHLAFRDRRFVLDPLIEISPLWRDPVSGLSVRQLNVRLTRRGARLRARGVGP